jgi:hypothetical protein
MLQRTVEANVYWKQLLRSGNRHLYSIAMNGSSASACLRCITLDVTGTLLAFKGNMGDYYCQAVAKFSGERRS